MPEGSDFQQSALFESEVTAPRSNPSNNTILPAQIAQNANFSDIFPFEFEANESPFLLSNAAVNEQKAITAIYAEAEVEGKPIQLILNSELAGSIITYQLMQQLQRTVDKPAQTVIVIADALIRNDWLLKANTNLDWETQKLKISYQGQYTRVPAICVFEFEEEKELPVIETFMALELPFNWAEETEQEIFEEIRE
ncbi:hypothetical protein G9A89_007544 [Geosiphon pyriformis]|nr:hypothetical protein G9A89_007544 [Geosiphon pyriformis]